MKPDIYCGLIFLYKTPVRFAATGSHFIAGTAHFAASAGALSGWHSDSCFTLFRFRSFPNRNKSATNTGTGYGTHNFSKQHSISVYRIIPASPSIPGIFYTLLYRITVQYKRNPLYLFFLPGKHDTRLQRTHTHHGWKGYQNCPIYGEPQAHQNSPSVG